MYNDGVKSFETAREAVRKRIDCWQFIEEQELAQSRHQFNTGFALAVQAVVRRIFPFAVVEPAEYQVDTYPGVVVRLPLNGGNEISDRICWEFRQRQDPYYIGNTFIQRLINALMKRDDLIIATKAMPYHTHLDVSELPGWRCEYPYELFEKSFWSFQKYSYRWSW